MQALISENFRKPDMVEGALPGGGFGASIRREKNVPADRSVVARTSRVAIKSLFSHWQFVACGARHVEDVRRIEVSRPADCGGGPGRIGQVHPDLPPQALAAGA